MQLLQPAGLSSHVTYKFGVFIVVTNRNNTLENHEEITLNKDDDIGGSQIPVKCGNPIKILLPKKFI